MQASAVTASPTPCLVWVSPVSEKCASHPRVACGNRNLERFARLPTRRFCLNQPFDTFQVTAHRSGNQRRRRWTGGRSWGLELHARIQQQLDEFETRRVPSGRRKYRKLAAGHLLVFHTLFGVGSRVEQKLGNVSARFARL